MTLNRAKHKDYLNMTASEQISTQVIWFMMIAHFEMTQSLWNDDGGYIQQQRSNPACRGVLGPLGQVVKVVICIFQCSYIYFVKVFTCICQRSNKYLSKLKVGPQVGSLGQVGRGGIGSLGEQQGGGQGEQEGQEEGQRGRGQQVDNIVLQFSI